MVESGYQGFPCLTLPLSCLLCSVRYILFAWRVHLLLAKYHDACYSTFQKDSNVESVLNISFHYVLDTSVCMHCHYTNIAFCCLTIDFLAGKVIIRGVKPLMLMVVNVISSCISRNQPS